MSQGQQVAERPYAVPAQRTPVQFDRATGGLRIGVHERRVDPSQPGSVYQAYLSLLYAVRGAKPGQKLPLRSADLEALLLIVGDDPGTIEQRLVGLMGCSADEAKALSGVLLRHRRLTATLGIAATLSLGAAAMVGDAADAPAGGERVHSATASDTTDPLESRRPLELQATAPTATALTPSGTTPVVVADADAAAVAPAGPRKAASPTSRTPARRASAPQAPPVVAAAAPAVAAPAPAAPVAPAPVAAPAAPVDVAAPAPADDAPAPVEGALPDAGIGEPAYEEAVPPEQIGGVADPSIGHEDPVAPPEVALPFPNAPRVEVVIGPDLVVPVVEPETPAAEGGTDAPGRGRRR